MQPTPSTPSTPSPARPVESAWTARLPKGSEEVHNARNYGGEKELTERWQLVAFDAREHRRWNADRPNDGRPTDRDSHGFRTVVDARCWMGRSGSASTVYAAVWIRTRDGRHLSGRGTAGGGGYHKESAAVDAALRSAGVTGLPGFGGAGEGPVVRALHAVADAAGYRRCPRSVV